MAVGQTFLARRLRWLGVLLVVVLVYGVVGYMAIFGWSFVDALYMTLAGMSTVGFREVRPLDLPGKLFTISVIVFGVTLVLGSVTLAAAWVAEGVLSHERRRKRMERRIQRLKDHFIVCAFGRVGRTVSREFRAEGVPFVVVERDEELEERMIDEDVLYLLDDPSQEQVLRDAGVERARGLICAVDSDATNVFITLTARAINPGLFIVARASESQSVDRLQRAGADRVISPYITSGHHMALMALRPGVVGSLDIQAPVERGLRLEEVLVEEGSPLAGKSAGDAAGKASLLAVRHSDGRVTANPRMNLRLKPGDVLILLGEEEQLRPVEGT